VPAVQSVRERTVKRKRFIVGPSEGMEGGCQG
jgi:hypothetical protein